MPTFIPLEIGTPSNGGSVVTAGGQATPIVYKQDGKEYVAIMAGGHHFMMTPPGDSLIAYALPDKK